MRKKLFRGSIFTSGKLKHQCKIFIRKMKIQRKGGLIRLRPEKYEEYKDRSYTYQGSADRPRCGRPFRALFEI